MRALLFLLLAAMARAEDLESLRLDQLQFLGSHNSYRLRTHEPLLVALMKMRPLLPRGLNPSAWDYTHEPLDAQLGKYNVRSLELDVYHDPKGGAFSQRQGNRLIGEPVDSGDDALKKPGFKVLHFPDFDYRTHHATLASALAAVAKWSDANPRHEPVFLHIETKDESGHGRIPLKNLTQPAKWDAAACAAFDAELRAAFAGPRLFTPDNLRGTRATLAGATWPTLAQMRGKILVIIEGCAVEEYRAGHPALEGRAAFIYGEPGRTDTAFLLMNNPRAEIARRVREGYIVRTRADAETHEARTGDTTRREAAFASGAHIITTDYYRPDPRGGKEWSDYRVQFPGGGAVRRNPISGK